MRPTVLDAAPLGDRTRSPMFFLLSLRVCSIPVMAVRRVACSRCLTRCCARVPDASDGTGHELAGTGSLGFPLSTPCFVRAFDEPGGVLAPSFSFSLVSSLIEPDVFSPHSLVSPSVVCGLDAPSGTSTASLVGRLGGSDGSRRGFLSLT